MIVSVVTFVGTSQFYPQASYPRFPLGAIVKFFASMQDGKERGIQLWLATEYRNNFTMFPTHAYEMSSYVGLLIC
ncbi:hypothetical protein SAMN04515695_4382 [Pseudovibrio sp. Tun.PSC04-5.I4]|nr:hypothetical protein SAMN04515695_4382 [Pseudovibrio sp. Tun.PSC04-5.I4]